MSQFRLSRRPALGDKIRVSFEFFPPKTDDMEGKLWETVQRLEPLRPSFVSVTYGAGGSTRERTARTVKRIRPCQSHWVPPLWTTREMIGDLERLTSGFVARL